MSISNRKTRFLGRKKLFFCGTVLTSILFFISPVFSVEAIRFYDWQADVLMGESGGKRCYIQFSGLTQGDILLSMHLSLVKQTIDSEKERWITLMKFSADKVNPAEPSERSPIKIEKAWLETSRGKPIEAFKKADVAPANHFLASVEGFEWFEALLKDMEKNGITVGYRSASDETEVRVLTPAPPSSLFPKLYRC